MTADASATTVARPEPTTMLQSTPASDSAPAGLAGEPAGDFSQSSWPPSRGRCVMRYASPMRTTLNIDEDVLLAAREMAAVRGTSTGRALSELARQALSPSDSEPTVRNGVPLLPKRPGERPVSMELVNRLLDQE